MADGSEHISVVHVITRLELGGAQLATLYELQHATFGARPRYLIFGPGGMLDAEAQRLTQIRCLAAPALARAIHPHQDARALWQIKELLHDVRRTHGGHKLLVHTHSSKAGVLGRIAARLAGAECIVHSIHGFGHQHDTPAPRRQILWASEKLAAGVTHGFTADSAANLMRGRDEGLVGSVPCAVVHCGIDVAAYAPDPAAAAALRHELTIPDAHRVVLDISCLKPQKNPEMFLRLAHQVSTAHSSATFLLVGDGELRPSLRALHASLGLGERCKMLGWRRDIPALLQLADVLVLTSRWEGLPQVFAQAMAAGKPIVATHVDGAPEAIAHGVSGFLVEPDDLHGMAQHVLRILHDTALGERLGHAGRARVGVFSQERMVADLDRFYAAAWAHAQE